MALPLWALAAIAGAAKSELIDRPKYERDVESKAIEARFAPLLGQAAPSFSDIKKPDTAQSAMDWGLTGAAAGSMFDAGKPTAMDAGISGATQGATEGSKILGAASSNALSSGAQGAMQGAAGSAGPANFSAAMQGGGDITRSPQLGYQPPQGQTPDWMKQEMAAFSQQAPQQVNLEALEELFRQRGTDQSTGIYNLGSSNASFSGM